MTDSGSRVRALTSGHGIPPVVASLVLAFVLAFPGAVFSGSPSHAGMDSAATIGAEAAHAAEAPCRHGRDHHGSASDTADAHVSGVGHHGGHHDAGGCCAAAACGGACAGVCSAGGASATLPGLPLPGPYGASVPVVRTAGDAILPGLSEAPFRPPIGERASSAS